ncbi:MAG: hypothetical protein K8R58_05415 [Bacteroidales bacterium]|nr:hypothetical protein [Bacteroidales bacterium]
MRFIFYIIIGVIILTSCNSSPNPERHLSKTNISIPVEYKILDFKSDWSIGESTENYKLLISPNDYKRITGEIRKKAFFQKLDTSKRPIYAIDNNTDMEKNNETACWYDNKYFYQIFKPNPGVLITIVLEKDSLMIVDYDDL